VKRKTSYIDREFEAANKLAIARMAKDRALQKSSIAWIIQSAPYEYVYHFKWLGLPIIQLPADIVALQEIIWKTKPDLIIETGVARGGSMVLYASMLELIGGRGRVIGIDIDIRSRNRRAIESHRLAKRIKLIEGSSTSDATLRKVKALARGRKRVLVVLDSNHTHEHVARELDLYSPLVKKGGYLLVFDTAIEHMPAGYFKDRPWDRGNNPMTAVREFLVRNKRFVVDREFDKLLLSAAPDGYLRCVKSVRGR
jgi:cephalosporin hydroxylase